MKKRMLVTVAVVIVAILSAWAAQKFTKKPAIIENGKSTNAEVASYWTCPMHPQIHSDHPGECPICHMKLVPVNAQKTQNAEQGQIESRVPIHASSEQMQLLGVQRTEVEKMDLRVRIPVSGRFLSSSAVAFQIYESDLRYVKPGLTFRGESSFYPEEVTEGVISSVDSIVDPTSRTIRVVGSVRAGPRGTLSETGFRGEIELTLKGRVAIPESSVIHTGAGALVYVFQKGNELAPKAVKLGIKSEGFYDVLEGLEAGQMISSGPNFLIDSEAKIRGVSLQAGGEKEGKAANPSCPKGQHWDIPMSMCMPGEAKQ